MDIALVTCTLIVAIAHIQVAHPYFVRMICNERADLWWPVALLKLPGSLVAPAIGLPLWGSITQVLFCFGIAEAHLGRKRMIAVFLAAHVFATLFARLMIALGPHVPLNIGLPSHMRTVRDTGPSAAVVGLGTYLGVVLKLPVLTFLLGASMVVVCRIEPGLAAREHLAAIALGAILGLATQTVRVVRRRDVPTYSMNYVVE